MAKKTSEQVISIPAINIKRFETTIVGDSPLIIHRFDEKSKRQILDKQTQKAKAGKEPKVPVRDFIDSLYWLSNKPTEYTEEAFLNAIEDDESKSITVRAFVPVLEDKKPKKYITIDEAMADDEFRQQIIQQALKELISFKTKYGHLKELSEVFEAIGKLSA